MRRTEYFRIVRGLSDERLFQYVDVLSLPHAVALEVQGYLSMLLQQKTLNSSAASGLLK
jgi:hypothetical protein